MVVALSRAKRGLYVFGNDYNLLNSSDRSRETRGKACGVFHRVRGGTLPMICKNHGNITELREPNDWFQIFGADARRFAIRRARTAILANSHAIPLHNFRSLAKSHARGLVHVVTVVRRAAHQCLRSNKAHGATDTVSSFF